MRGIVPRVVCVLPLLVAFAARGQELAGLSLQTVDRLELDDVVAGADGQRVVELYLRALTRHGDPIDDLRPTHLDIHDNGEKVDPDDVTIQKLGEARKGITWVIAIDASRTMMGETFERAKAAAVDFLDRIGSHDRLAIVTFAQTVEVVSRFEDSRAEAESRLHDLEVDQSGLSTLFFDGVYESLDLIRGGHDLPRRAAVIVFSDGKDSGSSHSLEEVVELAKDSHVLVDTIGYARFGGGGLDTMAALARGTGADFQNVTATEDLQRFFNEVWRRLSLSYVVRYPWSMDGEAHTIEVAVDGQSDSIKTTYPDISGPFWPWLLGVGAVLVAAVFGLVVLPRLRTAGRLVFVGGPRGGETFSLRRGRVRIGAIETNDLVIPSLTVSRYHAEVLVAGSRVEIKDLHSENGTLLNGNPVESAPIPLHPGDRISIADVDLVYER